MYHLILKFDNCQISIAPNLANAYIFRKSTIKLLVIVMPKRTLKSPQHDLPPKRATSNGFWAMGLLKTMEDPKYIIKTDNLVTVIKDMYPKAEYHYLVLPKENISSLKFVTSKHLSLLKHMEEVAKKLVAEDKHKHRTFKIGYHSDPSMIRLHLHVISDDMNSEKLKNKKHWNSYNTNFFLNSEDVIKSLEGNGKVLLPSREICKQYMDSPLKCHKCDFKPKNLPDLKKHIITHIK